MGKCTKRRSWNHKMGNGLIAKTHEKKDSGDIIKNDLFLEQPIFKITDLRLKEILVAFNNSIEFYYHSNILHHCQYLNCVYLNLVHLLWVHFHLSSTEISSVLNIAWKLSFISSFISPPNLNRYTHFPLILFYCL